MKEVCSQCKEQLFRATGAVAGPSVCFAADLVLGLHAQNYNLLILDGLIGRLRRIRKLRAVLNILRLTMTNIKGTVVMKEVDQK